MKLYEKLLFESITKKIDINLKSYIDSKVIPMYKNHDRAHDEKHAKEVIETSFQIAPLVKEDINPNLLYASSALHDVGLKVSRDNHNIHSAKIIRRLKILNKWFSKSEIEIIAQAAEDHRASLEKIPRNIYGVIVSDSDRCSGYNIERLMERTWLYRIDDLKNESDETIFNEMFKHMNFKFGKEGYAKLWLKETYKVFKKGIERTRKICSNRDLAWDLFQEMRSDGRLKR